MSQGTETVPVAEYVALLSAYQHLRDLMAGVEDIQDLQFCSGGKTMWNWYYNWKRENQISLDTIRAILNAEPRLGAEPNQEGDVGGDGSGGSGG